MVIKCYGCQKLFDTKERPAIYVRTENDEKLYACSESCRRDHLNWYNEAVQQVWRDEHKLWNGDFFLHVAAFTVGWIIFGAILNAWGSIKFNPDIVKFFAALCGFGSLPISLAQNIFIRKTGLDYNDYKTWYLPPIAVIVLIVGLSAVTNKFSSGMQAAGEKKAKTAFAKVYKPEMDIILGK